MKMRTAWMLDGRIDLSAIGAAANWHHSGMVDRLRDQGIDYDDAEMFALFIGSEFCRERDGHAAGVDLTQQQEARLSVAAGSLT